MYQYLKNLITGLLCLVEKRSHGTIRQAAAATGRIGAMWIATRMAVMARANQRAAAAMAAVDEILAEIDRS